MNMLLRIYYITFLFAFLVVFFQKLCSEYEELQDRKKKYCKNVKILLSADMKVPTRTIDYQLQGDSLYHFLEKHIITDSCSRNYFSIPFDFEKNKIGESAGVRLAAFIKRECPDPNTMHCIFISQEVRFYSEKNKVTLALDEPIHPDSIGNYIREVRKIKHELTGEDIFHTSIVMDNNRIEKSSLEVIIPAFAEVYLEFMNKRSLEIYSKDLCNLDHKQLVFLKKKYPLEIEILPGRFYYLQVPFQ